MTATEKLEKAKELLKDFEMIAITPSREKREMFIRFQSENKFMDLRFLVEVHDHAEGFNTSYVFYKKV